MGQVTPGRRCRLLVQRHPISSDLPLQRPHLGVTLLDPVDELPITPASSATSAASRATQWTVPTDQPATSRSASSSTTEPTPAPSSSHRCRGPHQQTHQVAARPDRKKQSAPHCATAVPMANRAISSMSSGPSGRPWSFHYGFDIVQPFTLLIDLDASNSAITSR